MSGVRSEERVPGYGIRWRVVANGKDNGMGSIFRQRPVPPCVHRINRRRQHQVCVKPVPFLFGFWDSSHAALPFDDDRARDAFYQLLTQAEE